MGERLPCKQDEGGSIPSTGTNFNNGKEVVMQALIDGDIIRYSVGFAAEDDPVEYCLHSVKLLLQSIIEKSGADNYRLFLTGSGNFRESIAVTRPYKGNRDALNKPTHYEAIKDYLVNYKHAEVVEGFEADDMMGLLQMKTYYSSDISPEGWTDTIICSLDKDMNMIPGWHYNWRKDEKYWVTEDQAIRNFYKQLLTGDTVDNIQGIPKVGPKTADKVLAECETEEDMYWAVLCKYSGYYSRPLEVMVEMGKLLWIWRKENDIWEPPY